MSALSMKYESYFINMVFEGKSLNHIVNESAEIIGTPVRFSPGGKIEYAVCSDGYPKEDIQYISELVQKKGEFSIYTHVTNREDVDKPFYMIDPDTDNPRIFCNVFIGSRHFGNISIPQVNKDLKQVDMDFIELISRTIALSCSVSGLRGFDVNKASVLQRILNGSIRSKEEIVMYFDGLREYEGRRWCMLSISVPRHIEETVIRNAMQYIFSQTMIATIDDHVIMLVDVTEKDLSENQIENMRGMVELYGCTVIKSLPFDELLMSREQMKSLNDHPAMKNGTPGYYQYEDHAEYALFFSTRMKRKQAMNVLCGKVKEIITYDREYDTKYFDTVCAYLDCSFSVQKTADSLYTHKNTIQYRIGRIEEIFDINLKDSRQIFQLMLGMSALEYWGE